MCRERMKYDQGSPNRRLIFVFNYVCSSLLDTKTQTNRILHLNKVILPAAILFLVVTELRFGPMHQNKHTFTFFCSIKIKQCDKLHTDKVGKYDKTTFPNKKTLISIHSLPQVHVRFYSSWPYLLSTTVVKKLGHSMQIWVF